MMPVGKNKKVIFSGIQPSGVLHIGNYLGAIKNWVEIQNSNDAETIFCIVDEHAITVPQKPEELRENTLSAAATYIACGINPKKSLIFVQSHVPAHAELGWILNTLTPLGELERMTQFKDKSQKQTSILAGLLNYPTLMAADILLYGTTHVPVGEDQAQHVELTRMLAKKFNTQFGETFTIPEVVLTKDTARIMGLDDPTKKMSKSASSEANYITLTDDPAVIRKKVKSATTDSGKDIVFNEKEKPGISNLLTIASALTGKSIKDLEKEFGSTSYSDFKEAVAEIIISHLAPIQKKYNELMENKNELEKILLSGAKEAKEKADGTMRTVREKIGFATF